MIKLAAVSKLFRSDIVETCALGERAAAAACIRFTDTFHRNRWATRRSPSRLLFGYDDEFGLLDVCDDRERHRIVCRLLPRWIPRMAEASGRSIARGGADARVAPRSTRAQGGTGRWRHGERRFRLICRVPYAASPTPDSGLCGSA